MELLQLVGKNANSAIAADLWLDWESLSPIDWNKIPGTPLKGLAPMEETVQVGISVQVSGRLV